MIRMPLLITREPDGEPEIPTSPRTRNSDDLPQPFGPHTSTFIPEWTSNDMSSISTSPLGVTKGTCSKWIMLSLLMMRPAPGIKGARINALPSPVQIIFDIKKQKSLIWIHTTEHAGAALTFLPFSFETIVRLYRPLFKSCKTVISSVTREVNPANLVNSRPASTKRPIASANLTNMRPDL